MKQGWQGVAFCAAEKHALKEKDLKSSVIFSSAAAAAVFLLAVVLFRWFMLASPETGQAGIGGGKETVVSPKIISMKDWIFGITVDDCWYGDVDMEDVVAAIRDMPLKPTVRVVMPKEIQTAEYIPLFSRLHEAAYIMACPVDSSDMGAYKDEHAYLERFQDTYDALEAYTDLWEIGNEINGVEWIGQEPELIVGKVEAANDWLRSQGARTALTMYYSRPKEQDMLQWMDENLPESLTGNVDFALISYYEDDNQGYLPEWSTIFPAFADVFPGAKVGFGECGNTAGDATEDSKLRMSRFYYTMEPPSEHYIGGCFWWNWVQDCVPHKGNAVYEGINRWMRENTENF